MTAARIVTIDDRLPDFGQNPCIPTPNAPRLPSVVNAAVRFDDLLDHLQRTTHLDRAQAARVVAEVLTYFSETTEAYVRRRHAELQHDGVPNSQIFEQISAELHAWRVRPPELSLRQVRRIVYG